MRNLSRFDRPKLDTHKRSHDDRIIPLYSQHWDSWSSYVQAAINPSQYVPEFKRDSRHTYSIKFHEAAHMAQYGWPEGAERLDAISRPILDRMTSKIHKPEIVNDITGVAVDIGAYLSGEPECFLQWSPNPEAITEYGTGDSIVSIMLYINAAAAFIGHGDMYFAKGAYVIALCEALEYAGKHVIIDVGSGNVGLHQDAQSISTLFTCRLKNSNDPINRDVLAFALCHQGSHTNINWGARESTECTKLYDIHYGSAKNHYGIPCEMYTDHDIVVSPSTIDAIAYDPDQWVRNMLIAQGVRFDT